MAKTAVAKRTFKIVDLIRKRDTFQYIVVPKFPVEVIIEVTTSSRIGTPKPAPSAVLDRLEAAARAKLDEYENIITEECAKIEKKIGELIKNPSERPEEDEPEKMAQTATAMVKNALESAQAAANKAVEDRLKKEAQGDNLLTEARVKTAVKVATGAISVGANVAKLVATVGADVTSYLSIAKTLASLGLELKQQLKGEEKLRKDLKEGVEAFLNTRTSTIMQALTRQNLTGTSAIPKNPKKAIEFIVNGVMAAGQEVTKGRSKKEVAQEVVDFVVKEIKGKLNDAESARVAYRNHTVKMRHNVDAVSGKADELEKEMRAAKNLNDGVRVGAECMKLKGKVRGLAGGLKDAETYLGEMQAIMMGGGLECDDSTVLQKLQALDVSTIFSEGTQVADMIYEIHSFVSNVAAAVA
jgi:hypothetical protein